LTISRASQENIIDIEEIQKLADNPESQGTILKAVDHTEGVRTIIAIE